MNSLWCPEMNAMYYKTARDFSKTEMAHKIMECEKGETMKYCHKYSCKWNIQSICEGGEDCMPNSLRSRLKKLVHQGVLTQKDLDRIVIIPADKNEKALKAAKVIKEYCKSIPVGCVGCVLRVPTGEKPFQTACIITRSLPETWEIEKKGVQDG